MVKTLTYLAALNTMLLLAVPAVGDELNGGPVVEQAMPPKLDSHDDGTASECFECAQPHFFHRIFGGISCRLGLFGHHAPGTHRFCHDWLFSNAEMPMHNKYILLEPDTYYFRPYNVVHIAQHRKMVTKWGGDPRHPYANELFNRVYDEWEAEQAEPELIPGPVINETSPEVEPAPETSPETPPSTPPAPGPPAQPSNPVPPAEAPVPPAPQPPPLDF